MSHLLKNQNFEILIDLPGENYRSSRFDWSGKISEVKYKNILISSTEHITDQNDKVSGKGFYNEFGIDSALGFDDAKSGEWFHKIGIGLLQKSGDQYLFSTNYPIRPAEFNMISDTNKFFIECKPEPCQGHSYLFQKEIRLHLNGFDISYFLRNSGEKDIVTDEYGHNFAAINKEPIGTNYSLSFPFEIKPEKFIENVNPEQKVDIKKHQINFKSEPNEVFFFSNLSGGHKVDAQWELTNHSTGIVIRELGNFQTDKVNLWGSKHVISPELFFKIALRPGESVKWQRNYLVNLIK